MPVRDAFDPRAGGVSVLNFHQNAAHTNTGAVLMQISTWAKRARSLAVALVTICLTSTLLAYPAHYFVINEAVDGALSVVSHQLAEIAGAPEPMTTPPRPGRLESVISVAAFGKDGVNSNPTFSAFAVSSPWLRGEFDGGADHDHIDGHHLPVQDRLYVVRVPVTPGQALRLSGTRAQEAGLAQANVSGTATLEIDLDGYLAARASAVPLAPAVLPPGYATGVITDNGSPANRLDLLIIGDGYTAAQQASIRDAGDGHRQQFPVDFAVQRISSPDQRAMAVRAVERIWCRQTDLCGNARQHRHRGGYGI